MDYLNNVNYYGFGDLIYGLQSIRNNYVNSIALFSRAREQKVTFGYVDHYIDFFNPYPDPQNSSPIPRQNSFESSIRVHRKYRSIFRPHSGCSHTTAGRKCKGGLYWAEENNVTVHFLLDEIDMRGVINKSLLFGDGYATAKPYTGSELRWLYRNRRDSSVQSVVKFWKDGKRVDAPWVTDKPLWDTYHPKSARENLASEPIAARTARRASEVTTSAHEVEYFFEIFSDYEFIKLI